VTDDDEIFAVTIPAGALRRSGPRLYAYRGDGIARAALAVRGKRGALLEITTVPHDLSRADRTDHMVTVALASGTYRASHTRLWLARGEALGTGR
jgi:hypothetical protein